MPSYKIDTGTTSIRELKRYSFQSEGGIPISPQELIYKNPHFLMNIPELEIQGDENCIVTREFSTKRGSIDVLIIATNADILIIETKLLQNSEAHRALVAQAIDYAKAFYGQTVDDLIETLLKNKCTNHDQLSKLKTNDHWLAAIGKN